MAKVLHQSFGNERGLMTTMHADCRDRPSVQEAPRLSLSHYAVPYQKTWQILDTICAPINIIVYLLSVAQ
jgi:hypothetical protein